MRVLVQPSEVRGESCLSLAICTRADGHPSDGRATDGRTADAWAVRGVVHPGHPPDGRTAVRRIAADDECGLEV